MISLENCCATCSVVSINAMPYFETSGQEVSFDTNNLYGLAMFSIAARRQLLNRPTQRSCIKFESEAEKCTL